MQLSQKIGSKQCLLLFGILLVFSFYCSQAQPTYTLSQYIQDQTYIDSAFFYIYQQENPELALKYFLKGKNHPSNFNLSIADCYLNLKDTVSAVSYLNQDLSKGRILSQDYLIQFGLDTTKFNTKTTPEVDGQECILLRMLSEDQRIRGVKRPVPPFIQSLYNNCELSFYSLSNRNQQTIDSVNLSILDGWLKEDKYPLTNSLVTSDYIFEIPTLIHLHQSPQNNERYIGHYYNWSVKKQIPYRHLIVIIRNRIVRHPDLSGWARISLSLVSGSSDHQNNFLLTIMYAAYLSCLDNPTMGAQIEVHERHKSIIQEFFTLTVKDDLLLDRITYSNDVDPLELRFKFTY